MGTTETPEIPFKTEKKNVYCEGGQIPKQISQGVSEESLLRDSQNPAAHGSGQPRLADPALRGGVKLGNLLRCLPA